MKERNSPSFVVREFIPPPQKKEEKAITKRPLLASHSHSLPPSLQLIKTPVTQSSTHIKNMESMDYEDEGNVLFTIVKTHLYLCDMK